MVSGIHTRSFNHIVMDYVWSICQFAELNIPAILFFPSLINENEPLQFQTYALTNTYTHHSYSAVIVTHLSTLAMAVH